MRAMTTNCGMEDGGDRNAETADDSQEAGGGRTWRVSLTPTSTSTIRAYSAPPMSPELDTRNSCGHFPSLTLTGSERGCGPGV
eukprot:768714-Hanusia_phi.AAC.1